MRDDAPREANVERSPIRQNVRIAACRCGRLCAHCEGEPVRVSVCHCLACQRRTGSAFAAQARFLVPAVAIVGPYQNHVRIADSGQPVTYRFCLNCGSTIAYQTEADPQIWAIPLGAFADPNFPPPTRSVNERRRHHWTAIMGRDVSHED